MIARSRAGSGGSGADYLYTFLRTFYRDETKLTGWNNLAFPGVGMPHVLWELQGERGAVFEQRESHGQTEQVFKGWEQISPGTMTPICNTTRPWVIWSTTCSGWASRRKIRAFVSACGCCFSWQASHSSPGG